MPLALAGGLNAQDDADKLALEGERPKIGLVLSGGGARGAAHVGVLKVLHELRVPIDFVAGNSMGALVGGTFSYGYSPDELQQVLVNLNWPLLLSDQSERKDQTFRRKQDDAAFLIDYEIGLDGLRPVLPRGIAQGNRALNTLKFLLPGWTELSSFDELPIPFRAVATDIANGDEVPLGSGSLPLALAASMSIPGVFAPVKMGNRELMDGMVVNNIPIGMALEMGADVLIVVDVGTPILKADEITSLLSVTAQMLNLLMQTSIDSQFELIKDDPRHTIVRPSLGNLSSSDFTRIGEAIAIGERAAMDSQQLLARYSVSEAEYVDFLMRQRRKPYEPPVVARIVIENESSLGDELIRSKLKTRVGTALDMEVLRSDLDAVIGTKEFELVTFSFPRQVDGSHELRIRVVEKSWGPNYLKFGLNLEDNLNGNSNYNMGVNYTIRAINELGGEWRNEVQIGAVVGAQTEFYQPLDVSGSYFISPSFQYTNSTLLSSSGRQLFAEFDLAYAQLGLELGANLTNWLSFRMGYFLGYGQVDIRSSAMPLPDFRFDDAFVRASLSMDSLDDIYFPSSGRLGSATFDVATGGLGADQPYQDLTLLGLQVFGRGRSSGILLGELSSVIDGVLPAHRTQRLGGFLNLSGTERDTLNGSRSFRLAAIGYRQVAGVRGVSFGFPTYMGGSLEIGNASDVREDLFREASFGGSVFLGVDLPIAPLYLAFGLAEEGERSLYLFLGQTF